MAYHGLHTPAGIPAHVSRLTPVPAAPIPDGVSPLRDLFAANHRAARAERRADVAIAVAVLAVFIALVALAAALRPVATVSAEGGGPRAGERVELTALAAAGG